jgi:hypothetical protein
MADDHDSNKEERHRRTTSEVVKLEAHTQTRRSSNSSKDTSTAPRINTAVSGDRTSVDKHNLSHSVSLDTMQQPKLPSPVRRRRVVEKDWESWRLHATGHIDDDTKHSWQQTSLNKTGLRVYDTPQEQSVADLSFSRVQQVLSYSPLTPFRTPSRRSLMYLGPQSSYDFQWARPPSAQPPSPDRSDLPKYMSAFEYAISAYLGDHVDRRTYLQLPSPKLPNAVSELTSPIIPHFEGDKVSDAVIEKDETKKDVPEYKIHPHLTEQNNIRTSIRFMHLRTLLMQCTVLQSTVRDLERQCWRKDVARLPYRYYSKMRQLAFKARQLAEELNSQDLEARCEYWAGRACGGTKDYQEAIRHFESAINLDVQNYMHPSGRLQLRGLRPREKDDVRFLLDRVRDRYKSWESKTAEVMKKAKSESDRTGMPVEECFEEEWKGQYTPPWLPDRDRVVQIARKKHAVQKLMEKRAKVFVAIQREELAQPADEKVQAQWEREGVIESEMVRRTLNDEEWRYIWYGDEEANKRRVRQGDDVQASTYRPTPGIPHAESPSDVTSFSPISASSGQKTPQEASTHVERNLAPGLADLEIDSEGELATPRLKQVNVTSKSTLQHRRNVTLDDIITANSQNRTADLGEDVRDISEYSNASGV